MAGTHDRRRGGCRRERGNGDPRAAAQIKASEAEFEGIRTAGRADHVPEPETCREGLLEGVDRGAEDVPAASQHRRDGPLDFVLPLRVQRTRV